MVAELQRFHSGRACCFFLALRLTTVSLDKIHEHGDFYSDSHVVVYNITMHVIQDLNNLALQFYLMHACNGILDPQKTSR